MIFPLSYGFPIYYDIQTGHVQNSPKFFHQDSNGISHGSEHGHRVQGIGYKQTVDGGCPVAMSCETRNQTIGSLDFLTKWCYTFASSNKCRFLIFGQCIDPSLHMTIASSTITSVGQYLHISTAPHKPPASTSRFSRRHAGFCVLKP